MQSSPLAVSTPTRASRADDPARAGGFERALVEDMRTPLQGIIALAGLLERQPLAGDGAAYVRTIADHGRALLRTLADADDLAQAHHGGLMLAPAPVRLRDLLDVVQTQWAPRAAADGVALGAFYEGDPALHVQLDRGRLEQVYATLVAEALRFTRRGGVEIGIKAVREGDRVMLQGHVRDTGRSVDGPTLADLFESGADGKAARKGERGHQVCRAILELMGGRIWAEPNAGAGLTVRFALEARAADTEVGEPAGPALAGRVLVVDDNATNRMVARTLVEMFGCDCETAEDGLEAVEAAARGRFDAVLMDIRMPLMDGVAATRAIHGLPDPAAGLPIIALTANADPEDIRAYLAAGMCAVVEKPIKAERLLAALTDALAGQPEARAGAAA